MPATGLVGLMGWLLGFSPLFGIQFRVGARPPYTSFVLEVPRCIRTYAPTLREVWCPMLHNYASNVSEGYSAQ